MENKPNDTPNSAFDDATSTGLWKFSPTDVFDQMIKKAFDLHKETSWRNFIKGVTYYVTYDPTDDKGRTAATFGPLVKAIATDKACLHFYENRSRSDGRNVKIKTFVAGINRSDYVAKIQQARALVLHSK